MKGKFEPTKLPLAVIGSRLGESFRRLCSADLVAIPENATAYHLDLLSQFDRIEMLHRRLHAFMGDVWADQLIIALHNITKTSTRPYQELLEQAAEVVVAHAKEGICNLSTD